MKLDISITTDAAGWMNPYVRQMATAWTEMGHQVEIGHVRSETKVDIAFYLSYSRLVNRSVLDRARSNIVVHGSDLPEGKGWSPWTWQILAGINRLPLTLFEATEAVDSGDIYDQRWAELAGDELIEEWQDKQARLTIEMCTDFVCAFPDVLARGRAQAGNSSSYPRRTPVDSRIDPTRPLVEQFNLLRVVDNEKYPAFFELGGHSYSITIAKRRRDS